MQSPSDVADRLAQMIAVGGTYQTLDDYLSAVAAVTAEDVARVARQYLVERRRFIVTLASSPASTDEEAGDD